MTEHLLTGLVSILAIGISAQWLAWRLKVPAILLLIIGGIVAGPVTGYLNPDALLGSLLEPIVSLSVAIILFEGGLSLRISELKEIGKTVGKLITLGVLISWMLTTVISFYLLDLGWEVSVLFGAILIVTGPTVIIPLLRQVRPSGKVGPILKWEGIVNDPIGAMLAVLVFELMLAGGFSLTSEAAYISIVKTIFYGSLTGTFGAFCIYLLLKRHLIPDFLQNPVSLVFVMVTFVVSNLFQQESGLLAVTIMGIILANQKNVHVKHIIDFKENLRVLLISALFIMLAARLKFEHFNNLDVGVGLFILSLFIIVRPLSILIPSTGSNIKLNEKLFLAFMAPRGIVAAAISAIFATPLVEAGYASAELLVPYTFLVILSTVTVYGLSANFTARKLGVAKPVPKGLLFLGAHKWTRDIASEITKHGFKVLLADNNWEHIARARQEGFKTYYGSILAEYAIDEIDLDGVGKLLAMTANDEVNSLAIIRYAEVFGSSRVFQLAPVAHLRRNEREVPEFLSGRILFDKDLNFTEIDRLFSNGAVVETVTLDEENSYQSFYDNHENNIVPLFSVTTGDEIQVFSEDNPPAPAKGDKVIYLKIPEREELQHTVEEADTTAKSEPVAKPPS